MYAWFEVRYHGGAAAVRAKSEEDAKKLYLSFNGYLDDIPGIEVKRIDCEEPESKYWNVIR